MDKRQAMEQLRRALQMYVATLGDEQAMEVATVYDVWQPGKAYKAQDILTYGTNGVGDPQLYRVVQGHTSQADWLPDQTAALYKPIGITPEVYPVWSQPTGAHDAYDAGDIVECDGQLWRSKVNGNVWVPGVYGWERVEP